MQRRLTVLTLCLVCLAPAASRKVADIVYAQVNGKELKLDLYLPEKKSPVVVYVHGGAWRSGSKDNPPIAGLAEEGFAVASVEYRLSPVARFPAQLHDLQAAIRFLREKQAEYGYDARRMAIAGSSAGGHLAALVGVTTDVQAIVSFYGGSNLTTILGQSTPKGVAMRAPALQLLLGEVPERTPELARQASPVFHVDPRDPPLLLLHGDKDPQMPIEQSLEFQAKYKEFGLPVHLEVVPGAGHGGKEFYAPPRMRLVIDFLNKHLRRQESD
jgi:acetyl esterase/lipase